MNDDPLDDVEQSHGWFSFGRQGAKVYQGALSEGVNTKEAMRIVTAFFEGMFKSGKPEEDEDGPGTA